MNGMVASVNGQFVEVLARLTAMEEKVEHLTKTADNMGYALYIMRESQKKDEEAQGSIPESLKGIGETLKGVQEEVWGYSWVRASKL